MSTSSVKSFRTPYSDDRGITIRRSSTTPLQKVITTQKGVAIDFDNIARDTQAYSKELYIWGREEAEDLKDGILF